MSASRNLTSSVKMGDGSKIDSSKPKAPRQSVCQRSTEASAATRKAVTDKAKNGTLGTIGAKLTTDRAIAGSAPKTLAASRPRTASEMTGDAAGLKSCSVASAGRIQAQGRANICESDGVLFDKDKRCSFMPESRKMNKDLSKANAASTESEMGRKTFASRDHASTVFSSSAAPEHKPSRVCNIQQERIAVPASIKSEATAQAYNAMNAISDASQSQRHQNRNAMNSSSIFSSNSENVGGNMMRPGTASSSKPTTTTTGGNNIFGGGAFAADAAKLRTADIHSRPTSACSKSSSFGVVPRVNITAASAGGEGGMLSARDRTQAALRGSGGLW